MKNIAFVAYRQWAFDIYKNILNLQREHPSFKINALITTPQAEFNVEEGRGVPIYVVEGKDQAHIARILEAQEIDVVLFYGWSWIVKEPILSRYLCLCLHPSPLPLYRGGSPLQHQIINGENKSAVTIFKMGEGIDDGDIYTQLPMALDGSLEDIFERMVKLGSYATQSFLEDLEKGEVTFTPQKNLDRYPPLRRRTKEESEFRLEDLSGVPYKHFYNTVRALGDPYPNVLLCTSSGVLSVTDVSYSPDLPVGAILLDEISLSSISQINQKIYVKLQDGVCCLERYEIETDTTCHKTP
jgi:methionyl-tRNA formyltransferase